MGRTILIAGGTGLIGTALCRKLSSSGFTIHLLSREPNTKYPTTIWNPQKSYYDKTTLPEVSIIINLAGTGIAEKPWTTKRKKEIIESRVESNKLIQEIIKAQKTALSLYISASAIGIYGNRGEEILDENSAPGKTGFLTETVQEWENAVNKISAPGLRKIVFRFGMVLSLKGGALPPLLKPFGFFIAPYFGNGNQYVSWIHIDDLCEMFLFGINNEEISGTYNAVSPNPVTNIFMVNVLRHINRSFQILLPVPVFMLRIILGEMADVILDSTKVIPANLLASGFKYHYPTIEQALQDIIDNKK